MHQSTICVVNLKITWGTTGKEHIPDVTAQSETLFLFEFETSDFISHIHTADR